MHTLRCEYVKLFNNSLFSFKSETSQNVQEKGKRLDFNFINTKKYSTPLTCLDFFTYSENFQHALLKFIILS